MKKIILFLIVSLSILSCDKKSNLLGEYYCEECFGAKNLIIEEETVNMNLLGTWPYKIENNRLYVASPASTFIFDIIDNNTLKFVNGLVYEGLEYKRKK